MDIHNLKIDVFHRPENFKVEIWLYETDNIKTTFYTYENEMWVAHEVPHEQGPVIDEERRCFLRIDRIFADKLFRAFAEALNEMKIRTPDENLMIGKMDAMKLHLEDMREIVSKIIPVLTQVR